MLLQTDLNNLPPITQQMPQKDPTAIETSVHVVYVLLTCTTIGYTTSQPICQLTQLSLSITVIIDNLTYMLASDCMPDSTCAF